MYSDVAFTFSKNFLSLTLSSTQQPTEQAKALPPKVEPWVPGTKCFAKLSQVKTAPIGRPEAKPLAEVKMSGLTGVCS